MVDFKQLGVSGLRQFGGYVDEEWERKLRGEQGRRIYREMSDSDETIGALLFAVEMLLRNAGWRVERASDTPDHVAQAEFVESLLQDMSHTWEDFIAEALSMLVYGFAPFEIVYKRRDGPLQNNPARRSKYDDGLIGWRKLSLRSQDTLERWEFDPDDGGILGMWQRKPDGGSLVFIPIEKLLIFRTTSRKSNPEGRSILRNAWISWYHKRRIENYEAIGVERDLAGLPILYLPPEVMNNQADAETRALRAEYEKLVSNIRNDEQAGVVLPMVIDPTTGQQLLRFELMTSGGTRQFDTNAILERKRRQILMVVLADFIAMGHEKVGSFALSSDKTSLFATALGAWLKEIAAVFNRHAIPRLFALNGWSTHETPQLVPEDLEAPELDRFTTAVANLTSAGFLTAGSEEDEQFFRNMLSMPGVPEDRDEMIAATMAAEAAAMRPPETGSQEDDVPEEDASS